MTELLLTNGYTPSRVRACNELDCDRVAKLQAAADRLSRRPKAVRGKGKA